MKRTKRTIVLALTVCAVAVPAAAAIPKASSPGRAASSLDVSLQTTRSALDLPINDRISRLRSQGPDGYRHLVTIMFSDAYEMPVRWKAVTAAGWIGGKEAKPEIERALKSHVWFMRNAGLLTMASIDRDEALFWARKLLSDKALVVRASAVDVIAEMNDRGSTALLWKKLNAAENYKSGRSLYIRRRIVETLARLEGAGQEGKFIKLLTDKDESLHEPALQALERITKKMFGPADAPLSTRRAEWLKWWNTHYSSSLRL